MARSRFEHFTGPERGALHFALRTARDTVLPDVLLAMDGHAFGSESSEAAFEDARDLAAIGRLWLECNEAGDR